MHQSVRAPLTLADSALVEIARAIVGNDAAMVGLLGGISFTDTARQAYERLLDAAETVLLLDGENRLAAAKGPEKSAKILLTDLALGG